MTIYSILNRNLIGNENTHLLLDETITITRKIRIKFSRHFVDNNEMNEKKNIYALQVGINLELFMKFKGENFQLVRFSFYFCKLKKKQ